MAREEALWEGLCSVLTNSLERHPFLEACEGTLRGARRAS